MTGSVCGLVKVNIDFCTLYLFFFTKRFFVSLYGGINFPLDYICDRFSVDILIDA